MPQPDYRRSMVINGLLKDYAAVAPHLKTLRRVWKTNEAPGPNYPLALLLDGPPVEKARAQATEWFNRVFALYANALLSVADLQLVADPRAARLWVDYVAPFDRAVREAAHGPDAEGSMHPVEAFWRDYAAKRLRVFVPQA